MSQYERNYLRVRVDKRITVRHMNHAMLKMEVAAGTCADMSVAGMGFVSPLRFPIGSVVEIELLNEDGAYTMKGQVVRLGSARNGHDHGVRFFMEDQETAEALEELSASLGLKVTMALAMKAPTCMADRAVAMQPCQIGCQAFCCKQCLMGPCRVMTGEKRSVCGADQALVVAKNILRFAAAGAATHCGHARHFQELIGAETPKRYVKDNAPSYLYDLWERIGVLPSQEDEGYFFDLSESLHLSTFGVDSDFRDVLRWCLKIGIIDGYYGLYLASELERRVWGYPEPRQGSVNPGCLDPDRTNIALHGHEPLLATAVVEEARNCPDINLIGICCTGATLLAHHGVPTAAHATLQEEVVRTGLMEALVVDVQCVAPSLGELCDCFHTRLITTSDIGRIPGALHLPVTGHGSEKDVARKIIETARARREHRKPGAEEDFRRAAAKPVRAMVGFSPASVDTAGLCDRYRKGEIKGFVAVVGCVNPRSDRDAWVDFFRELGKDRVIFTTGCMAFEFARSGLLDGERFFHLGSCVNSAHIAEIFRAIADGCGRRIDDMPFLASAPMPVTEKSIAIGLFFAALGCSIHLGYPHLFSANIEVVSHLNETLGDLFNSRLLLCDHPRSLAEAMGISG